MGLRQAKSATSVVARKFHQGRRSVISSANESKRFRRPACRYILLVNATFSRKLALRKWPALRKQRESGAGLGHFEAGCTRNACAAVTTALVTLNKRDQRNRCHVGNVSTTMFLRHGSGVSGPRRGLKKPLRGTGRTSKTAILACVIFSNA